MNTSQKIRAAQGTDAVLGNLTQFEHLALGSQLNLSDGHARQPLTPGQAEVVAALPVLWATAAANPVEQTEANARRAYFHLLGQHSFPTGDGRVLSCYSSSVAMEILARSLATQTDAVALLHPTFDNIPDLLLGAGLRLRPLAEKALHDGDLDPELLLSVGCVFVTTPNNPTGRVLSQERLRALAEQCAAHDVVLALDTSFRGFDVAAHYDHYAVLESSGCRWVVIEDTGKLWPTQELKIGWLVSSADVGLPLSRIYSDILLGVSPVVMMMVQRFAEDAARGGLGALHRFIADNRAIVRSGLTDVLDVGFPDPESRVSVERVDVGWRAGLDVWQALRDHDVHVLPCQKFHWAAPSEGDHVLRIALSRAPAAVASAADALREVLTRG